MRPALGRGAATAQREWLDGMSDALCMLPARLRVSPPFATAATRSRLRPPGTCFAGSGPINTDDRPVILFQAPDAAYRTDETPASHLLQVLAGIHAEPADLLGPMATEGAVNRLRAYWMARNRFIALGADIEPSRDPRQLLARVQEPWPSVLAISPDFTPASRPLRGLAAAVATSDPETARRLLESLKPPHGGDDHDESRYARSPPRPLGEG